MDGQPKEKYTTLLLSLTQSDKEFLRRMAFENHTTMAESVRQIISFYRQEKDI